MPSSVLAIISSQRGSRSTDAIVRAWVPIFAELIAKDLTASLVDIWCRLLADIEPGLLEQALEQTAKTMTFFPTPGQVRKAVQDLEAAADHERRLQIEVDERHRRELTRAKSAETYKQIEAEYESKRGLPKA